MKKNLEQKKEFLAFAQITMCGSQNLNDQNYGPYTMQAKNPEKVYVSFRCQTGLN